MSLLLFYRPPTYAFTKGSPVVIPHTLVGASDLTDFPVLVRGNARFKDVAHGGPVQSSSGFDILWYADSAGTTPLNYRLIWYDPVTGDFEFRVRIPFLSHTVDTTFYALYGCASITTDGSSTATFTSDYDLVMPMGNGATLDPDDFTANANNGTLVGSPTPTTGQIGGAAQFNGSNYIEVAASSSLNETGDYRLTCWLQGGGSQAAFAGIVVKVADVSNDQAFGVQVNNSGNLAVFYSDNISHFDTGISLASVNDGAWHKVTIAKNASLISSYLDGAFVASATPGTQGVGLGVLRVGIERTAAQGWNGPIDQVVVMSADRDSDWEGAEYQNEFDAATFAALGTEFNIGGTTSVSASSASSTESLLRVAATLTIADESRQGITAALIAPYEFRQGIATTALSPDENVARIASPTTSPSESKGGVTASLTSPDEWIARIAATAPGAHEWLARIAASGSPALEWILRAASSSPSALEWLLRVATTAASPDEALQGILATLSAPDEWLQRVTASEVSPEESLGLTTSPVSSTVVVPFEVVKAIAALQSAPDESLARIAATITDALETLARIAATTTIADESVARVAATGSAADEALASAALSATSPTERRGGISQSAAVPSESVARVAITSIIADESLSRAIASATSASERLAGVSRAAVVDTERLGRIAALVAVPSEWFSTAPPLGFITKVRRALRTQLLTVASLPLDTARQWDGMVADFTPPSDGSAWMRETLLRIPGPPARASRGTFPRLRHLGGYQISLFFPGDSDRDVYPIESAAGDIRAAFPAGLQLVYADQLITISGCTIGTVTRDLNTGRPMLHLPVRVAWWADTFNPI